MPDPNQSRVIRVFISSTFRDMQGERDYLVKFTFPQLRKLCEERAVTWTEVDLRWGITTEESAEGKVLPLCLAEIERCRPWFIGLLGERYGWVPPDNSISEELLESQPWLRDHLKHSVTELEIMHAVLRNPAMADRSLFYFRDPSYLDRLPAGAVRADFTSESPVDADKLAILKNKIRVEHAAGKLQFAPRENYINPEALGEQVLEDFTDIIEKLYPKEEVPEPLDQEAARQEAYAKSRRLAFVGREELLRRMNEHTSTGGKPLVLTGDSGCGKSALLAEWVARWRNDHPDDLIIQHYIGSTPDSADWQGLVRRILGELKRAFVITDEIPVQPDALRGALNDWTVKAVGSRLVVLVLDALNQLAEEGAARQLGWLPVVFPANFRVLVSSLPGESLDALRKRGWSELNVPLFARTDIAPAALAYFKTFSKTPPSDLLAKLESTPAAGNALYLRAVLDELRQFGKHEELKAKADDYLSAPDLPELFNRILERWENDFDADIVRQNLSLVWAARRGLSEVEILDLLGQQPSCDVFSGYSRRSEAEMLNLLKEIRAPREALARAKWAPFFLASEAGFVVRTGLLTFSHSYLREAVEKRYLPTTEAKRSAHERVALYFELTPLPVHVGEANEPYFDERGIATSRALDEEPWQLQAACRWEALANHLSFLPVFRAACATGRDLEWMQYWQRVLSAGNEGTLPPVDIPSLYLDRFRRLRPAEKSLLAGTLGQFLRELGFYEAAQECFQEEAAGDVRFSGERFLRAANLNDQGLVLFEQGENIEALGYFNRAIDLLRNDVSIKRERRALASVLMNKANALRALGTSSESLPLLELALELMKETEGERSPEVATVMQSLGHVFGANEDLERELFWQKEAYRVRRENFGKEHRDVGLSLGNLANPLAGLGRIHCAMRLRERAFQILRQTYGDEHHLTRSAADGLSDLKIAADNAMANESEFGLILLVFESLPSEESPPDPATPEGVRSIAQGIADSLARAWDDMVSHGSSIPVLLLSCPGFDNAISLALDQPIAKLYPTRLLCWIRIPGIEWDEENPAAFAPLVNVRQDFLTWLEKHSIRALMVKPLTNIGAQPEREAFNFIAREVSPKLTIWSRLRRMIAHLPPEDWQPLAVEVVPFDNREGPITGLYTGEKDPRPCVMPASAWKEQGYSPQPTDQRATGAFYLNLPATRRSLSNNPETGLTRLDEWSMTPLMSMATRARAEQLAVFETALSELMLVVKASLILCPAERGLRGFETSRLDEEAEGWLS